MSIIYDKTKTKKELLKIFRKQLQLKSALWDPVTRNTYNALNEVDKQIIQRFANNYRKSDNYTWLELNVYYSRNSIKYRLNKIFKLLYNNIDSSD